MATPASRLLTVARAEIGYVEGGGPHGNDGNITKYWAELDPGLQGQPWCAGFVSWCFARAGCPLPAIDRAYGFVYCPDEVKYARDHGILVAAGPAPGDIALYGFGTGTAQHTGIVEQPCPGGACLWAIEGNTSPGDAGSQANGGGVYRRHRLMSQVVGLARIPLITQESPVPVAAPMHVTLTAAVVDTKACPSGGYWQLTEDGNVWSFLGAPYHGGPGGRPYFAGRSAAQLVPRPGATGARDAGGRVVDPAYAVLAASGERYGDGGY